MPAYQGLAQDRLGPDGAFTRATPTAPIGGFFAPPPAAIASGRPMLITGNGLFHNGYLTEHSEILNTVADDPYVEMGARPSFTCAPYLLEDKPAKGEEIAWAESNAVIYANSVLGARTVKHPDFLDLCIALTGRAPRSGVYETANRAPRFYLATVSYTHLTLPTICSV